MYFLLAKGQKYLMQIKNGPSSSIFGEGKNGPNTKEKEK